MDLWTASDCRACSMERSYRAAPGYVTKRGHVKIAAHKPLLRTTVRNSCAYRISLVVGLEVGKANESIGYC